MTRAGSFVKNGDGELVNAAGYYLLGYPVTDGSTAFVANGFAGLERVTISDLALQATPTTAGALYTNVPADAPIVAPADLPSANNASATFAGKTSLLTYGNLGREVSLDIYYAKTANNTWEISAFDRSEAGPGGEFPYASGPLVTQVLTYDGVTGALTSAPTVTIPIPDGSPLVLDLAQSSQLAGPYTIVDAFVNGNGPSAVDRVEIDVEGTLYSMYENGARIPTFRIPLADVPSPDNLQPLTGDIYTPTSTSGDMLIGFPAEGGYGTLNSTALEQSTVDLANELTILIEAERHYTVNSKVFQTGSDLLDVIVNLKR
jgi:flagellar hook protein FlgE